MGLCGSSTAPEAPPPMKEVLPASKDPVQKAERKNEEVVQQSSPSAATSGNAGSSDGGKKKRGAKKKRNKGKSRSLEQLNEQAIKEFRKFDVDIPERLLKDPKLGHHQDIKYGKFLGFGSYGDVVQATYSGGGYSNLDVACKKMNQTDHMNLKKFLEEATMMSKVEHPKIISLVAFTLVPPLLLLEYMDQGTLSDWTIGKQKHKMNISVSIHMLLDVAMALKFLHDGGGQEPKEGTELMPIIHRDIKCDNILVNGKYIAKLADFGESRVAVDKTMTTVGTPACVAPEILLGHRYNAKVDCFSFSMVIYESLYHELPYFDVPDEELRSVPARVARKGFRPTKLTQVTDGGHNHPKWPALVNLMTECWDKDQEKRPSAAQLVERLTLLSEGEKRELNRV